VSVGPIRLQTAPLVGRGRPVFGTKFGMLGHARAFESGDMSRHSKIRWPLGQKPIIVEVAVTLLRLFRRAGSLVPTILRALLQFAGSMVDQFPSRQAWS